MVACGSSQLVLRDASMMGASGKGVKSWANQALEGSKPMREVWEGDERSIHIDRWRRVDKEVWGVYLVNA